MTRSQALLAMLGAVAALAVPPDVLADGRVRAPDVRSLAARIAMVGRRLTEYMTRTDRRLDALEAEVRRLKEATHA